MNKVIKCAILLIGSLMLSCANEDKDSITNLSLESFSFLKENNPQLKEDVSCNIIGDSLIEVFLPHISTESLVATFAGEFRYVEVGGVKQQASVTANNFNQCIHYILIGDDGKFKKYTCKIRGYNGVPRVFVKTEGLQEIKSKENYLDATIRIDNSSEYNLIESKCQIKGRGNGTWKYPKKPYKVKMSKKTSLFGFPEEKDWVLLAEYNDRSLLRHAYMCEVSKAFNIDYTVNYKHVELFVNDVYMGVYVLTDQVEKSKSRVIIDEDGYLIENDNYADTEPLAFWGPFRFFTYTFKYPNPDKNEIALWDEKYTFISKYVNEMGEAIKRAEKDSTYLQYIDAHSFAKWLLAEELLGNYDPNLYFVLPSRQEKMKMMPLWDAEWSLGLATFTEGLWKEPPYLPQPDSKIWINSDIFLPLLKNSFFIKICKEEWDDFATRINVIEERIHEVKENIRFCVDDNFNKWQLQGVLKSPALVALGTWELEAEYATDFFHKRYLWINQLRCNNFN